MLEGSVLSSARCSGGLPPLHEAYENGIGDLKLGRRAVTTNLPRPPARSRMARRGDLGARGSESSSQLHTTHIISYALPGLAQGGTSMSLLVWDSFETDSPKVRFRDRLPKKESWLDEASREERPKS